MRRLIAPGGPRDFPGARGSAANHLHDAGYALPAAQRTKRSAKSGAPAAFRATLTSRCSGYTLPSGDRLSLPHSSELVPTCYLCDVDF